MIIIYQFNSNKPSCLNGLSMTKEVLEQFFIWFISSLLQDVQLALQ